MITEEQRLKARCRSCGYLLRDLPEPRCPECGRRFDADDAATVWLPTRPNAVLRWFIQPPGRVGRAIPLIAVLLTAWGTRLPGDDDFFLPAALYLAKCGIAVACVTIPLRCILRWRGYDISATAKPLARWHKHLFFAVLIIPILVLFRPLMLVSFWISRPWMDATAKHVLAEPFNEPPRDRGVRGVYYVYGVRRCPHGVKIFVTSRWEFYDNDPGFFYRDKTGPCSRFELGVPLGGGWYLSPGGMIPRTWSEVQCAFSSLAGPD